MKIKLLLATVGLISMSAVYAENEVPDDAIEQAVAEITDLHIDHLPNLAPVSVHQQIVNPLPSPDNFPVVDGMHTKQWADSVLTAGREKAREEKFKKLTEEDFREVAEELGVETAAIKAVVDIEAGKAHEGFYKPGKPIINFDLSMYQKFAPKRGVSLASARKQAPVIFNRPNTAKYGSYQAAQYARLDAARAINEPSALESAFWGMFQIGGFNWKICGCESVEDFVERMSRSERDQLELFAAMIKKCGMVDALKNKQWLSFALKYNGPRAKARGYHTRMASAYARHKSLEKQS